MCARSESVQLTCLLQGILFLGALGMHFIEGPVSTINNHGASFSSYASCLFFMLVTLTTIGYGDLYPTTIGGRAFVCMYVPGVARARARTWLTLPRAVS